METFQKMDGMFKTLSQEAGAPEGESCRIAGPGLLRLEILRSKTNGWDLDDWGPRIAKAAGCDVKIWGFSDDGCWVVAHLDADNWNIGEDGVPKPFPKSVFSKVPGQLWKADGSRGMFTPDDDLEKALHEHDNALAPLKISLERRFGLHEQEPSPGSMRLAQALEDSGVDIAELAMAIGKLLRE